MFLQCVVSALYVMSPLRFCDFSAQTDSIANDLINLEIAEVNPSFAVRPAILLDALSGREHIVTYFCMYSISSWNKLVLI